MNVDIVVHWQFDVYIMLLWIHKLTIFNVNCMLKYRSKKMGYDLKVIWYKRYKIEMINSECFWYSECWYTVVVHW